MDTTGDPFLVNGGTDYQLSLPNTADDLELIAGYRIDSSGATSDYVDFNMRYNATAHATTGRVHVRFHTDRMELLERYNGVWNTATFTDVTTELDTIYNVYIRCVGDRLEVFRRAPSGDLRLVGVLEGLQTQGTTRVGLSAAGSIVANFGGLAYFVQKTNADSFTDDFADGNYTASPAWTVAGGWGVFGAEDYLANTSASGNSSAIKAVGQADAQLKVSVNKTTTGGSLRLYSREVDGTHKVYVEITDSTLKINQQDGATSTLETKTIATSASTWYDYHIISDGSHMEVWRGPHGGATELMLETDALTIWNSDSIILESRGATASYDNVEFIAADTAKTVMDYDAANELTTSITGAITTTYAYDDWGRTISKTDGTLSAEYLWRFGDKLKEYNTDFPGEHSVAFN